jgi:hypothetical protein
MLLVYVIAMFKPALKYKVHDFIYGG